MTKGNRCAGITTKGLRCLRKTCKGKDEDKDVGKDEDEGNWFCHIHEEKGKDEDRAECTICFEPIMMKNREKLECGHVFHNACIVKWLSTQVGQCTCPTCRHPVNLDYRSKLKIVRVNRDSRDGELTALSTLLQFMTEIDRMSDRAEALSRSLPVMDELDRILLSLR